jgi:hypothetical protein
MRLKNNHILIEVDFSQNTESFVGNVLMPTAKRYNENFRERTAVVAKVLDGFGEFKKGTNIVCNYSLLQNDSVHKISESILSINVDELIIAIINEDGSLKGVNTNILVNRVPHETFLEMPEELKKHEKSIGIIAQTGQGFKCGDIVIWYPMSDYEIVYMWNNIEKRAIKVYEDEIVAVYHK